MNILLAPDKFKGSLDSFALCHAMKEGVLLAAPNTVVNMLPMADGGDGFATILAHYTHGSTVHCNTTDPLGRPIKASFEWNGDSKTAIIEMAAASGLALLTAAERNPMLTTTIGTGTLIKAALEKGATTIFVGLGGTATNDAGTGILHALGYRFYDSDNNQLSPCGASLGLIKRIVVPEKKPSAQIIVACDVNNPLVGPNGCAHIYAAQKGADKKQIEELEKGMQHFAVLLEKEIDKPISNQPKMGAAGGTTAGLSLLPNTILENGVDIILQQSNFHQLLAEADLIITGEGAFDAQTLNGKVVYAVAQAAKAAGKPVVALCGKMDADEATIEACGLSSISSINDDNMTIEESITHAYELTVKATTKLVNRFIQTKS